MEAATGARLLGDVEEMSLEEVSFGGPELFLAILFATPTATRQLQYLDGIVASARG